MTYGVSFTGTCFGGTSPADADAFQRYVGSVLTHLLGQGYRAIALCNAHLEPDHIDALRGAAIEATRVTGLPVAFADKREGRWAAALSEEFRRGARHAWSYETSLVMVARPGAVRREQLESLPSVWVDLPARLREGARSFADAGGTLGYFGDPARATPDEGERLFTVLAEMVRSSIRETLSSRAGGVDPR